MAKTSRKIPAGARPARRPLRTGGNADGYLQGGTFYPFDPAYALVDFLAEAYVDDAVRYDPEPCDTTSSDAGSSDPGGYDSSSPACDSPSSSDTGSGYADSGSSYSDSSSSSYSDSGGSSDSSSW